VICKETGGSGVGGRRERHVTVRRQGAMEEKGDRGGERSDVSDPSHAHRPLEKGSEAKRREIRREREALERSSSWSQARVRNEVMCGWRCGRMLGQ
jgi:hypothetical protein